MQKCKIAFAVVYVHQYITLPSFTVKRVHSGQNSCSASFYFLHSRTCTCVTICVIRKNNIFFNRLSDCSITKEGYKALSSALRSNPSHLIELDLTGNDPGPSGVKQLSDLLQDPNCQLNTLRFLGPAANEGCQYVTGIVGKNPLLLRKLNLSEHKLGDTGVNQISALLQDKHCTLNTLNLCECSVTEKQCLILTSALKSNPSHLRELNLSGNKLLGDSGVKNLSDLLMNTQFKLEKLDLSYCSITEKQCLILTSALKSNPSHLRELNLSRNKLLGDSGVKNLSDLLMNTQFKLEKLELVSLYSTAVTVRLKITLYFHKVIMKLKLTVINFYGILQC
uniref:Uncharacterized protein n=1 Tax=Cyprinus carpio TaxID=7962 RepID=A0A8C1R0A6_CYPCA